MSSLKPHSSSEFRITGFLFLLLPKNLFSFNSPRPFSLESITFFRLSLINFFSHSSFTILFLGYYCEFRWVNCVQLYVINPILPYWSRFKIIWRDSCKTTPPWDECTIFLHVPAQISLKLIILEIFYKFTKPHWLVYLTDGSDLVLLLVIVLSVNT